MERILALLAIVGLSLSTFYFWENYTKNAHALAEEKELRKIKISDYITTSVEKHTFLEIKNDFYLIYDETIGEFPQKEGVFVVYEWSYTFSLGFNVPNNWNWCPKIVDESKGIIQVNAPEIVNLDNNPPAPVAVKYVDDAWWHKNKVMIAQNVKDRAAKRIAESEKVYLQNPKNISAIKNSLATHIQTIMNSTYAKAHPISEVRVVIDSVCK